MKRLCAILSAVLLGAGQLALAGDDPRSKRSAHWEAFSKNLVENFQVSNEGLHLSTMQRIIQYADSVDVDEAVFHVVRYYRDHKDLKVRQLALTTLYKIRNQWSLGFLRRAIRFEESPVLKQQICAILKACGETIERMVVTNSGATTGVPLAE